MLIRCGLLEGQAEGVREWGSRQEIRYDMVRFLDPLYPHPARCFVLRFIHSCHRIYHMQHAGKSV